MFHRIGVAAVLATALACAATAGAKVVVFQNGVGPAALIVYVTSAGAGWPARWAGAEYAGCRDTWISTEQYEGGSYGASPTLTFGGDKRSLLIAFDLSAIPKDDVIHKAVLRLADVGYPRPDKEGKFPSILSAYVATQEWKDAPSWAEWDRTPVKRDAQGKPDPNWKPEHPWKTPGGDFDPASEAKETRFDTGSGHVHEWDVTAAVKAWQEGKTPNNGLLLRGSGRGEVVASEWYVPAARPMLIVDHGPKGSQSTGVPELKAPPKDIALDETASTADAGQAKGEYADVRAGQNSNCVLRGASTDTYVKEAVLRYPATWGWYDMARVGGRAGDVNHALLYFDLKDVPKDASIKEARLVLSLAPYTNREVGNYRYGAFLLKLPEAPGWSAGEATLTEARAGKPWPGGMGVSPVGGMGVSPMTGIVAASAEKPVALGKVVMKEVDVPGGRGKAKVPGTVEFDLTGAVRAWVAGKVANCGVVIDGRIEGGAFDFYSSRAWKPELRPYLQITCSPAIAKTAEPIVVKCALPEGDYWVEPMKAIHKNYKGKPGVLAQYGDSITITMAFLAPHSYGQKITADNIAPEVQKEMDVVTAHADRKLWSKWKDPQWGNNGQMMSSWLVANIDGWQKKMQPEASVILFGSNDFGGCRPPDYTENMGASIRRMLEDGTVPMLTTVPPASGRDSMFLDYYAAHMSIAQAFRIPVIDYYMEIMKRRPEDWNGAVAKFRDNAAARKIAATQPTMTAPAEISTLISTDGVHPSFPKKWSMDWSEDGLSNSGYTLRNYMTLRMYAQVISKVFLADKPAGPAAAPTAEK